MMMSGRGNWPIDLAPFEDVFTSVPLAVWTDGSTVHSVLVSDCGAVAHEYRVCRCGQVLAKLTSLAAVDQWRLRHADEASDMFGVDPAA